MSKTTSVEKDAMLQWIQAQCALRYEKRRSLVVHLVIVASPVVVILALYFDVIPSRVLDVALAALSATAYTIAWTAFAGMSSDVARHRTAEYVRNALKVDAKHRKAHENDGLEGLFAELVRREMDTTLLPLTTE